MIKRLSVLVVVVAGLAIVSSPAGAALLVAHRAGDGTLQTDTATGTVRFDGQGVAYGRVNGKGTIKVKGTKGRYLLNSTGWRAMPSGGRSFSL